MFSEHRQNISLQNMDQKFQKKGLQNLDWWKVTLAKRVA
jgi:hypothetical protein